LEELPLKHRIGKGRRLRFVGAGLISAALLAAALPAAISTGASAAAGATGAANATGTLTIGIGTAPQSLDPSADDTGDGLYAAELLYEPLINETDTGTFVPGLATSWNYVGTGNKEFVMNIRQGAEFSDGEPVNAAAVVAGLEYNAKGTGPAGSNFAGVTATATGPYQVTITATTPNPEFPLTFSQRLVSGDIVCPNSLKDPSTIASAPCGAGPYVLDSSATTIGSVYTFTANPDYWDQSRIHYHQIVLDVISNPTSALDALESGQIQVLGTNDTTTSQLAPAKAAGLNVTVLAPTSFLAVWIMDRDGKVFKALGNLKVREALNYALNRSLIAKAAYGTLGAPDDEPATVGWDGWNPKYANYYPYNVKKAKQLLAEAGYPHGFSFNILYITSFTASDNGLFAMAQEWKAIGVKATLVPESGFPPFSAAQTTLKYSSFMLGWGSGDMIPQDNLLWIGKTGANSFYPSDPELYKLFDAALGAPQSQFLTKMQAVTAYAMTDALQVIGAEQKAFIISAKGITGLVPAGSAQPAGMDVVNISGT
jgi:peptide/nickel transport system substrate-binding protein